MIHLFRYLVHLILGFLHPFVEHLHQLSLMSHWLTRSENLLPSELLSGKYLLEEVVEGARFLSQVRDLKRQFGR